MKHLSPKECDLQGKDDIEVARYAFENEVDFIFKFLN